MLDKLSVLGWGAVEHDLYEENGHIFGIELDLFNEHKYHYHKQNNFYDYLSEDIYEAIEEFNAIVSNADVLEDDDG